MSGYAQKQNSRATQEHASPDLSLARFRILHPRKDRIRTEEWFRAHETAIPDLPVIALPTPTGLHRHVRSADVKIAVEEFDGEYHVTASIYALAPGKHATIIGSCKNSEGRISVFSIPDSFERTVLHLLLEEFIQSLRSLGAKSLDIRATSASVLTLLAEYFGKTRLGKPYRYLCKDLDVNAFTEIRIALGTNTSRRRSAV